MEDETKYGKLQNMMSFSLIPQAVSSLLNAIHDITKQFEHIIPDDPW